MKIKKIVVIIITFLILLCFNSIKLFATEVKEGSIEQSLAIFKDTIENLGNRPYFLEKTKSEKYFSLYTYPCVDHTSNHDFKNDKFFWYLNKDNVVICRNETKGIETNHFTKYTTDGKKVYTAYSCINYYTTYVIDEFLNTGAELYTSSPIYSNVNKNGVFFFKAFPTKYQIAEITQVEELPKVIMGTLKVIMPVGLIIFGMLLLICLVRYVISQMT